MLLSEIRIKRLEVNKIYVKDGYCSPAYEKAFDELHDMNMLYMAENYRKMFWEVLING